MRELDARDRALRVDEARDALQRLEMRLDSTRPNLPAKSGPSGVTAAASVRTSPAPPTARVPRWTKCQSFAKPVLAGILAHRRNPDAVRKTTSRKRSSLNKCAMRIPFHFPQASAPGSSRFLRWQRYESLRRYGKLDEPSQCLTHPVPLGDAGTPPLQARQGELAGRGSGVRGLCGQSLCSTV